MDPNEQIDSLECFPCGPRGFGGGRTKEPIDAIVRPIHARTTIFSLPHACLAAGLFEVRPGVTVNWQAVSDIVTERWKGDSELFLSDAVRVGVSRDSAERRAAGFRGAIIGWRSTSLKSGSRSHGAAHGICADLEMTLTILSRRVGDIFIANREPDYGWNALFGSPFECDEDLGPAPNKQSEPWSRFQW